MSFHGLNGNISGDPQKGLPLALNVILEQLIILRAEAESLHVVVGVIASKHGITPERYLEYRKAAFQQTYDRVAADVLALIQDGLQPPSPPIP